MFRKYLAGFLVVSAFVVFFPASQQQGYRAAHAMWGEKRAHVSPSVLLAGETENASAMTRTGALESVADTIAPDIPGPAVSKIDIPDGPAPILQAPATPKLRVNSKTEQALALIKYPWQELGFEVVSMGRRAGYRAMTLIDERRIEVYERPGEGPDIIAFDLAHEFGHAFDLKYNDDQRRAEWKDLRGIPKSAPWFGCNGCPDYGTPAGDFAETFAYLLLGPGSFHSRMAPPPKEAQVAQLASFCKIENVSSILLVNMPARREDDDLAVKLVHAK